jgi:hypothetical protein
MEFPTKPAEQETVAGFHDTVETFPFYKMFDFFPEIHLNLVMMTSVYAKPRLLRHLFCGTN